MRFEIVDGCPVPVQLADEVRAIKALSGATLESCDRSPDAEPLLARNGKHSQRQLYQLFLAGKGNPANRPGESTHERRNDGVAYRGPVGMPLRYRQVGMDWDIPHVQAVVKAAAQRGFTATVTYPTSTRERQHVNFRREPKLTLFRPLRHGQTSPRVASIRSDLSFVHDPQHGKPYLASKHRAHGDDRFFDEELVHALREFQRDHGQKDDGIYGLQTARQLAASLRFRKRRNKERR